MMGFVGDGKDAIRQCKLDAPDVVIMAIHSSDDDCMDLIRSIKNHSHQTAVLMLSSQNRPEFVARLIEAGADGFINNDVDDATLLHVIHVLLSGFKVYDESIIGILAKASILGTKKTAAMQAGNDVFIGAANNPGLRTKVPSPSQTGGEIDKTTKHSFSADASKIPIVNIETDVVNNTLRSGSTLIAEYPINEIDSTHTLPGRIYRVADGVDLSERDLSIIEMIMDGYSNRDIARRLRLREGTTKNLISLMLSKTGTSSRTQLVKYALDRGLIIL